LRARLETDGLLFLPGTIARSKVMSARSAVLKSMADAGGVLDPSTDWNEAVLNKDCSIGCVPFMEGGTQLPSVMDVAEGDELRKRESTMMQQHASRRFSSTVALALECDGRRRCCEPCSFCWPVQRGSDDAGLQVAACCSTRAVHWCPHGLGLHVPRLITAAHLLDPTWGHSTPDGRLGTHAWVPQHGLAGQGSRDVRSLGL
jgi:hypothetical protein